MASGVVRAALCLFMTNNTKRGQNAKECVREFLKEEYLLHEFEEFATQQ